MDGYLGRLHACVFDRWAPKIGDPTVMGWLTVAAYFAAVLLAVAVLLRPSRFPEPTRRAETLFWAAIALAMVALGVNKQLDLQSFFTAVGRCASQLGGWYEQRRPVQAAVVAALLVCCVLGGLVLARLLRGALARNALALAGLTAIAAFVLVRAVGFTHVDALINFRVADWRMNWILELGGIALLSLGAVRVLTTPSR